jgi:hypothetical protein
MKNKLKSEIITLPGEGLLSIRLLNYIFPTGTHAANLNKVSVMQKHIKTRYILFIRQKYK